MMDSTNGSSSKAIDRRTIEKNRRDQMKILYSQLNSLVSDQGSKNQVVSLPDQLDVAINYIKKLQKKLERMKEKKESLMRTEKTILSNGMSVGVRSPQVEIHRTGSALGVVLISGMDRQSMFYEIVRVLHEEGAEVVNATFSIVHERIFHTIHSEVGESSVGDYDIARISRRLQNLVHESINPL